MLVQKLCLHLNRDNHIATDGERFSNAYSFSHIEKWIATRYPTSYKMRYIIFCHLQFGPQSLCSKNINKHVNLQSKSSRMTLGISFKNRLSSESQSATHSILLSSPVPSSSLSPAQSYKHIAARCTLGHISILISLNFHTNCHFNKTNSIMTFCKVP
jgi:hypothetical protein